jgi:hypothetical protein
MEELVTQGTQGLQVAFPVVTVVPIAMMELLELFAAPTASLTSEVITLEDAWAPFEHALGAIPVGTMKRQG